MMQTQYKLSLLGSEHPEQPAFQGVSKYTPIKEFGIQGVTSMRLNQFKSKWFGYKNVLVADVFCGTGRNVVDGIEVDGSPISILNGIQKANNANISINTWFSDIRQEACDVLKRFVLNRCGININPKRMAASDAINELGNYLSEHHDTFLVLVLDPNGPKDFPKHEVCDLLEQFNKRVDVIPYISATAINRQLQARNKAGMQLKSWIAEIENFDSGFVQSLVSGGREGWIRKPLPGDNNRWTMIPTFGCLVPRNAWEKRGYVDIKSDDGKDIIKFYCGGL